MPIKKLLLLIMLSGAASFGTAVLAQQDENELGQTIQIRTRLHSFVGKPSWLLIIRDIDHNQNIPYLYDFTQGTNFWLAFTYGRNYLITVSEMTFDPYCRKIHDFCGLESMGAIQRGTSLQIDISGDLSQNTDTFTCHVLKYADSNFNIVNPE